MSKGGNEHTLCCTKRASFDNTRVFDEGTGKNKLFEYTAAMLDRKRHVIWVCFSRRGFEISSFN